MGALLSYRVRYIANWTEYAVLYKLRFFVNSKNLSQHMKFSDVEVATLGSLIEGFNQNYLNRVNNVDSQSVRNITDKLIAWEREHQYEPSEKKSPTMSYNEIIRELISDSNSTKLDKIFPDSTHIQNIERRFHLDRATGCLEGLRLGWELRHFSKTTSSKHWNDRRMLEKSIQYGDKDTVMHYLPLNLPINLDIVAVAFYYNNPDIISCVIASTELTPRLAILASQWDQLDVVLQVLDEHPDIDINEIVKCALTRESGRTIQYFLPRVYINTDNLVSFMGDSCTANKCRRHADQENYRYYIFEEPKHSANNYHEFIVDYLLARSDITSQNLLDMATKLVTETIKDGFIRAHYRNNVPDNVVRRVVNHPLFIQGLRDDSQQTILENYGIQEKIFCLCDTPYDLLSIVTLRHLRLPEDKAYIDFILNKRITSDIPANIIVQEISMYVKGMETSVYHWNYIKENDKRSYIIESLLLKPQIQVAELEKIIVTSYQELDNSSFYRFEKILSEHPLISQVDPNFIVLRFGNSQIWKISDYIHRPEITLETVVKILEHKDFDRIVRLSAEVLKLVHVTETLAQNFFIRVCDISNESRKNLGLNGKERLTLLKAMLPHLTIELIQSEMEKLKPNIFWRKTLERYLKNPSMSYDTRIKK